MGFVLLHLNVFYGEETNTVVRSSVNQLMSFKSKLFKGALLNLQLEIVLFLYLSDGFIDYGGYQNILV